MHLQDNDVVIQLLKRPALTYVRELRSKLESDPRYLDYHTGSVTLKVRFLLSESGIDPQWELPDDKVLKMLREAMIRLGSFEKA